MGWQGGDPDGWRDRALAHTRALILPDLPPVPFAPMVEAEEDRGDHVIRLLRLHLAEGLSAPALFAVPKGQGPFPAVLALHDHGSEFRIGKEKCLAPPGPVPEAAELWWGRFFGGRPMAQDLLRRGYAVLSVDALGWGGRPGNGYADQQALAANLLNLGLSAAGLMAWEDLRAAEFLATCAEVDPGRIAAVGFSMGAFRAWQVAALSPHVGACVAACWMASLPGLLVEGNNQIRGQSAFWMTHPMLYRDLDLPDIAALAAPKPALFLTGLADPLFPPAAVDPAFDRLAAVWSAQGAAKRLALHRLPGGHHFGPDRQALAFDWLDRRL
ncbi:dienelactone hydrolase family protein [Neotabrizicola sp. VNH66]|uniref:dienelactone hydrolase family protein n=1 Tax=Neotabrizicola sp. VNH66 TaxID=3400918 RepID=UPI003C09DA92